MGWKETLKQSWTKKMEKEYSRLLSKKKVDYHTWIIKQEKQEEPTAFSNENSNGETVEYILLLQKNGCLSGRAHALITKMLQENPQVQIVYGEEDLLTEEGSRENPWYKPCWSPDLYLSQFYVGSVVAIRKELMDLVGELSPDEQFTGQVLFEKPEEVRPLLNKALKICGAFEKGCEAVIPCPHVLFHVQNEKVWEGYLSGRETTVRKSGEMKDISVIIPSKDNPVVLGKCMDSLKKIPGLEIIIVDNGSNAENRDKVRRLVDTVNTDMQRCQSAHYLYYPMEFNFSKMCNMGAKAAFGKYLLFLNDDIEACGTEWIYAMRQKAAKPYVGAVGLKLYYPEGIRIQHAGITNLPVGPVHKMQFAQDDKSIYFDKNRADVNCLAVTGACLMIEKEKYTEAGGFKEDLRVAYNDVELGFSLYEAGYHNVVLNSYYAYHHESLSRGNDESKEKLARLFAEREKLYRMHPALKGEDPYYPTGLSRDGLDSRIVPAYIHELNTVQTVKAKMTLLDLQRVRVDQCLFLGIEQSEQAGIKGYGVVLGDNNACYDRYVVLAEAGKEESPLSVICIKTTPQYRQDLEENMADQTNVALCGFHVRLDRKTLEKLKKDVEYRIGVMAVHRFGRGRLLNWSGRYFKG